LTLLLDLPVEIGLARKGLDEQQRFEAGMDLAYHQRVRAGFLQMATADPDRFVIVDATAEMAVVQASIRRASARLTGLDAIRPRRATIELPEHEEAPPPSLTLPDVWSEVAGRLDREAILVALATLSTVQDRKSVG